MRPMAIGIFLALISMASIAGAIQPEQLAPFLKPIMKVYFLPFHVHTQILIRKQDIEKHNDQSLLFLRPQRFIKDLRQMLEARPTQRKLSQNSIRLKVEFLQDDATFYADRLGVVEKNGVETFELLPEEMEQIRREMERYYGVVELNLTRLMLDAGLFPR